MNECIERLRQLCTVKENKEIVEALVHDLAVTEHEGTGRKKIVREPLLFTVKVQRAEKQEKAKSSRSKRKRD